MRSAVVAAASSLCGLLTLVAQGLLPGALAPVADSASGWTLVTVLLLAGARVPTAVAAALGAASSVLLTPGYAAAAQLQGLSYDPTLSVVVGVVVGPVVGVATSWLRAVAPWRAATGTALLAGIGVGGAAYGLTTVADTTSPVCWVLVGAVALALLGTVLARRVHGVAWSPLAVVGAAVVAGGSVTAHGWLGGA